MSARSKAAQPAAEGTSQSTAVMPIYARLPLVFERGEGAWLITATGERYLDFASGVAVCALGHAHPHLVAALVEQAQKLWHTSNLFCVGGQESLAARLAEVTFAERVFFCNSGAEACEAAIKAARRFHFVSGRPERWRIITFSGAFHGRTLATIAAGGNPKYLEGFGPPVAGFDQVPFGDLAATERAIGPETAAIMVEPIQGEGGVHVLGPDKLAALRALCDKHGLLLILDEIQCGMGRTGTLFAYEQAGIEPDLMAIAKGIGGGFPVGALLASAEAAKGMTPGTHGSTYGGNLLAMAVANSVLDVVLTPGFLDAVNARAAELREGLESLHQRFPNDIAEVRGQGLLTGLKLAPPMAPMIEALVGERLLVAGAADNVIRLLPPLTVTAGEIDEGLDRLAAALATL